jgi:tetratricopeptide (TPR) repeat protein
MTGRRRGIAFCCALALALALSASARAEDAEAGRRLFKRGQELLKENDYRAAAKAFEAGYAAAPRAGFLLNIGNCYRKLGELSRAREYYWHFLDSAPKDHPSRPAVMDYLKAMEQIEADGVAVDTAGTAGPRAGPAGGATQPTTPTPLGERQPRSLAARPLPPPPLEVTMVDLPPPPEHRPLFGRWWFWTLIGAAVAGGATAYVLTRPSKGCGASLGCGHE